MRSLFFLFLMTFTSVNAMEWLSYEEGLKLQKQNGKVIMIDVVRTECHFCRDMEVAVFDDKEMIKWLDKRFIPVKVNLDKDRMPLNITVSFTPSFFFVDKNGEIVKSVPGSWNIEDFKDLTKGIK